MPTHRGNISNMRFHWKANRGNFSELSDVLDTEEGSSSGKPQLHSSKCLDFFKLTIAQQTSLNWPQFISQTDMTHSTSLMCSFRGCKLLFFHKEAP